MHSLIEKRERFEAGQVEVWEGIAFAQEVKEPGDHREGSSGLLTFITDKMIEALKRGEFLEVGFDGECFHFLAYSSQDVDAQPGLH